MHSFRDEIQFKISCGDGITAKNYFRDTIGAKFILDENSTKLMLSSIVS